MARGSAHVEAWVSAHVVARDSAHVEAWDCTAIRTLSPYATITTGPNTTIIREAWPTTPQEWAAAKNLPVKEGSLLLWKAIRPDGTDFRTGTVSYLATAEAPDWEDNYPAECGAGLHLADSPSGARYFVPADARDTFRLFQVRVAITDCAVYTGGKPQYPMKLRARRCEFVREVPRDFEGD